MKPDDEYNHAQPSHDDGQVSSSAIIDAQAEGRAPVRSFGLMIGAALWLVLAVAGSFYLVQHAQSPGPEGTPPALWPGASRAPHDPRLPTLVMFVHPQCPCSRASIGELEVLMTHCQDRLSAQVWFLQPEGMTEDWAKTDLWRTAEAIPGVTARLDGGGIEARRFHAETSGQTVLYDRDGTLLFHGGITMARGHFGDNPGSSAVLALVAHELSGTASTPVFGCALADTECLRRSACQQ